MAMRASSRLVIWDDVLWATTVVPALPHPSRKREPGAARLQDVACGPRTQLFKHSQDQVGSDEKAPL